MAYSWDSGVEPYNAYLGRRAILDEQKGAIRSSGESLARQVSSSGESLAYQITSGISAQTRDILGSLESLEWALSGGFESVGRGLDVLSAEISSGLGHVAHVLDSGFASLLRSSEEIRHELQRLIDLVELEEQRKAMENFRYAVFALQRGLWDEALDYVTAAIEGDAHSKGYKLDWHFHWVKGELLLGAPARHDWDKLDPAKAEQAFLLASRYAKADVPDEAAKALLLASVAAYAQSRENSSKLQDMRHHAEAAHALDQGLTEAAFQVAKSHMALDKPESALPALREAIERDAAFAVRAAEDPDHRRHEDRLKGFFAALRDEKAREITNRVRVVNERLGFADKITESAAREALARIRAAAACDFSGMGLVELLSYGATVAKDVADVEGEIERCRRIRRGEQRIVTTRWEEEARETYVEDVVVKPGGWFRKPVIEKVKRTRDAGYKIERTRDEKQWVVVDGFGDIVEFARLISFAEIPPGRFGDVAITRGFLIGVGPVTQLEYEVVTGKNPSHFKGPEHPVEEVSWLDAVQFCNAISRAGGLPEAYEIEGDTVRWLGLASPGYRLPTEAEWEYACRAGSTKKRYGPLNEIAWYDGNSGDSTHPVGKKMPNAFGLYDMLGNVWEWCWDWDGEDPAGEVADPVGPAEGSCRVNRGGSWFYDAEYALSLIHI